MNYFSERNCIGINIYTDFSETVLTEQTGQIVEQNLLRKLGFQVSDK
jgi:hypothetical protein